MLDIHCYFCDEWFTEISDLKKHLQDWHEFELEEQDMSISAAIGKSVDKDEEDDNDDRDSEDDDDTSIVNTLDSLSDTSSKPFGGFGGGNFSGGGAKSDW